MSASDDPGLDKPLVGGSGLAPSPGSTSPRLERTLLITNQISRRFEKFAGLRKGSLRAAVYNLFSSVLGAGILGLPFTATRFGLIPGLALILPFAACSLYTLRLLEWTAVLTGVRGYRPLAELLLGPRLRRLVALALVFNTFGSLVVYLIVIGDLTTGFARSALAMGDDSDGDGGVGEWLLHVAAHRAAVIVAVGVLLCLPLSLTRDLSALRYTSLLSLASIAFLSLSLAVRAAEASVSDGGAAFADHAATGPQLPFIKLVGNLPTFIYAFSCHFNYFSAVDSLARTTPLRVAKVQNASIGLTLLVYLVVVLAVGALYGTGVDPDFLVSLDPSDGLFAAAKCCYLVVLVAAFPLNAHPCAAALRDFFNAPPAEGLPRALTMAAVVGVAIFIAVFCPNITVALSLVGGTATASIIYIFPAIFFRRATRPGAAELAVSEDSPLAADISAAVEVRMLGAHRCAALSLVALGAGAWVCSLVGLFAGH